MDYILAFGPPPRLIDYFEESVHGFTESTNMLRAFDPAISGCMSSIYLCSQTPELSPLASRAPGSTGGSMMRAEPQWVGSNWVVSLYGP